MEFSELVKARRCVRDYQQKEVPDELILKVLEAGRWAPSAGNLQPAEFVVVRDEKTKQKLSKASLGQSQVKDAPVVIVVCANLPRSTVKYGHRAKSLYVIQDCAAAAMNIFLMAVDLGLSSCWVGAFSDADVSEVLGLPEFVKPQVILPIGYPAEEPKAPKRRPLAEMTHKDKW